MRAVVEPLPRVWGAAGTPEGGARFLDADPEENGRFSEYGDGELNLAPTAFATKLIRETLVIVANGPPIDPDLYEHVLESQRRPVHAPPTSDALWDHSESYVNQYSRHYDYERPSQALDSPTVVNESENYSVPNELS